MKSEDFKIGSILIIIGIILGTLSLSDYLEKRESLNYLPTRGHITEFKIIKKIKGEDQLKIIYEYNVEGDTYYNNIVGYGVGNPYAYADAYKSNQQILVYYNERNPKVAVLVKGVSFTYAFGALIGALILIIGITTILHTKFKLTASLWDNFWG